MTVGSSETLTRKGRNGWGSQDLKRSPRQPSTLPIRAPTGFATPAPRLVRGPFGALSSVVWPPSGKAWPSDRSGTVMGSVLFAFVLRGRATAAVELALLPCGTTEARHG